MRESPCARPSGQRLPRECQGCLSRSPDSRLRPPRALEISCHDMSCSWPCAPSLRIDGFGPTPCPPPDTGAVPSFSSYRLARQCQDSLEGIAPSAGRSTCALCHKARQRLPVRSPAIVLTQVAKVDHTSPPHGVASKTRFLQNAAAIAVSGRMQTGGRNVGE